MGSAEEPSARRLQVPLPAPIGPYILDFYCAEARLAVEIDGESHWSAEQAAHDARRDAYFRAKGIETLRLSTELLKAPGKAADFVLEVLRRPFGASAEP